MARSPRRWPCGRSAVPAARRRNRVVRVPVGVCSQSLSLDRESRYGKLAIVGLSWDQRLLRRHSRSRTSATSVLTGSPVLFRRVSRRSQNSIGTFSSWITISAISLGRMGRELTRYDIACWLEQNPQHLPDRIEIVTNNPAGRSRIEFALKRIRPRETRSQKDNHESH